MSQHFDHQTPNVASCDESNGQSGEVGRYVMRIKDKSYYALLFNTDLLALHHYQ